MMFASMNATAPILLVMTLAGSVAGAEPLMETAAGVGTEGNRGDGGPAVRASLNMPFDIALDRAGNIYFSDTFNHTVRRIDSKTGRISTVAGSGRAGFSGDDGPATAAQLREPYGVVLDSRNNLYLVDRLNQRVRMVDAETGTIRTVAGNGSKTFSGDGGPAVEAGLVEPNGIALDPAERRLYIADVAGHRIRAVDLSTRIISTFAGTGAAKHDGDGGPADKASVWGARAVDVAPDGTVYIIEREGNRLRGVDPETGIISTRAGTGKKGFTGDGGPAIACTFNGPKELAVDRAGNVWIVDTENHAIRVFDPKTGLIRTAAGTGKPGGGGDGGSALAATLDRPHGVAVGPDGSFWIGDTHNNRVRRVRPIGSPSIP
jgi:DNA-binding beta-propeller fold protein YncE